MAFSSQTNILIVIALVLVLVYFFYGSNKPIHNEGMVEMEAEIENQEDNNILPENMEREMDSDFVKQANIPEDEGMYFEQKDYAPPESDWLKQKFNSRNKSRRGFKKSSFSGALRGNLGPADWDDYFDHNNNVIGNSQTGNNDRFLPMDESSGNLAIFKNKGRNTCGSNQNCEPEDLFDVDKYLPQEVNDDWFEVQPEPISVKNRHLINITKPIGINTIGTSLRNASYDVRGVPSSPKFAVSPWLNSSIEPDTNLKPLM